MVKKLSLPKTIKYPSGKYGLVTYNIIKKRLKDDYGMCNPHSRTIYIRSGMSDRKTIETLIHELIHLIEFEDGEIPGLTHRQINKLDVGLSKLIMENLYGKNSKSRK